MADVKAIIEDTIDNYKSCTSDVIAQEVLDELSDAGYRIIRSPRMNDLAKKDKYPLPANFLQGEWM